MSSNVKKISSHPSGLAGWCRATTTPTATLTSTGITLAASAGTVS